MDVKVGQKWVVYDSDEVDIPNGTIVTIVQVRNASDNISARLPSDRIQGFYPERFDPFLKIPIGTLRFRFSESLVVEQMLEKYGD